MILPFPSSPKKPPITTVDAMFRIVSFAYLIYLPVTVNIKLSKISILSEENFAGNIIINLASLPNFLRTPILKKRMMEFFSMDDSEKTEIINNALEAGPTIPFPNFSKLFKTWLEILCTVTEENRYDMFSNYFMEIIKNPEKIILFNLDGIFEIFSRLDVSKQKILSKSIQDVFHRLNKESKRRMILITPNVARKIIGF